MSKKPFQPGGLVRLKDIIGTPAKPGPFPVSRAHWYVMVQTGQAPQPVQITCNVVAWRADELNKLIADLSTRR